MKKFSEFVTESEQEKLDEGALGGFAASVLGVIGGIIGIGMVSPLVGTVSAAVVVAGAIEFIISDKNFTPEDESGIVNWFKKQQQKYMDKKFMDNMSEEDAQKILDDVEKRKSKLTGGQKGAVTKLQNELERAFQAKDHGKIGKILKKFIADNQKD